MPKPMCQPLRKTMNNGGFQAKADIPDDFRQFRRDMVHPVDAV